MPSVVSGQQNDRSLEQYLATDFRIDQQEISALEQTLLRVQNTFNRTFAISQWPYEIQTKEVAVSEPDSFSQGTAAMVLGAAGKLIGICTPSSKSSADTSELRKHWKKASTALLKDLRKTEESYEGAGPANIRSSSFGNDNAMTATPDDESEPFVAALPPPSPLPDHWKPGDPVERPLPVYGVAASPEEMVEMMPKAVPDPDEQYRSGPGEFGWEMLDDEEGMAAVEDAVASVKRGKPRGD